MTALDAGTDEGAAAAPPAAALPAEAVAAGVVPAVQVTGYLSSAIRNYDRVLPGIREYNLHRHLAPETELRFGMVTSRFPMKPLSVKRAALEGRGGWSEALKVVEDGWMLIPDSPEAERRKAELVVSRRNAYGEKWVIDIHTPSLPPQVYRLGDLRLECRVYLAIEWAIWKGRMVMGSTRVFAASEPPMDEQCNGTKSIFFNTRPWPRLQAYELRDGDRKFRVELDRWQISSQSFMLKLGKADTAWSDNTQVEFYFYDNSHWGAPTDAPRAAK